MLLVRLSTHWFFVKLFFMVFLFMIRSIEDATLKSCPAKLDGDLSWPNTEELSCSTSQPICLNTNLEISKRCCGENLTWDEAPKCYSLQQDIINPCPDTFVGIDNICIFAIATTFPPDCPFAETLAYDEYAAYIKTVQYPVWLPISREDGKYGKGLFYWNEQSALYKTTSTLSNVNFSHDELLLDNHCLVLIKPDNVKAVPCDEIHTAICAYRTLPDRKKSFCSQTLGQACEQSTYSPKSACFCKEHDKNLEGNKIELQMPYQNLLYTSLDEVCDIGLERKDDQYFWTYSNVSIDYTNWSPNTEFGTNFAFGAMSSDGWVLKENKDNKCSLIEKFPPYLNDSLILRYDNTSFTFTVSLTNAAYWKHKEDMEEPLLFCFTDGAEDLIVKRLDLLKSIINNVFTFLPSEGPGHYWCEGFLYPDLEVRKSNVYFLSIKCNFIDGAVWSELDRNCFSPESVSPTLILSNLLTVKNPFLYISLFIDTMKRISDFTAEDVELCARYLQVLEEYGSRITSLSDFTSLISAIMQVPSTILKQSQQTYNSTNSILHSVSKILEKTDTFTNDTTEYLSIVIFSIEEFYSDTLIWTKTDDHAYSIKYVNSTDMNIFELEQEEEFDLGLRFNKGLIENATRSSDCKKIIVIAYFKPTLFNEDVTRNYTSTVFTTIFPNLDETGSDIQDLVTTIYKHDNPLDEYICSYWAEGYWYHKYVIEENNKTFVCSFQKMANVAMVSKANMYDLLTELLELECGVALEQALQYVKEYLSSFTDADVAKLYHILRQCQNFADTDIIMNIIDKILEMPMKLVTNAIEDYSLKFYDLLEGILEYREESYISEFKHFAVAVQYLKEDNLTGFYIDCYQFKCKIVFMHDYTQIPSSSELYLMIEEDLLNELLRIKVEKIIITLFANDVFFSTTQEYTNKALSKVVGVLLPDLTKLKRLDGRISVTYVLGAGSKNESCHTWNDLWVPSNQVRQIRHGTYRCESWYPGYFVLFYDTLNVTQLLDDAIHEQNIPFHNIINNITTISAEYLTKIRAVDIKLLANYLEESKESNFTNMQLILPDAFNASINLTSILLNVDREMFQEDETKDSGDKILSYLFHVADLLEESYSSCTWNVIFEVLYLNQNGVLGLQITDTSNYCKYKNKLFDFIINSSGIWLDSLLVSQLMEHGVQKLYLIVFSCDSFFYNGEILTNNDQVFGLYVPNIDNTFSNQVTVIFNPNVFTPGNAGCVTWEDVSTKYIKKGQWGLQKQLDSNGGCQWFQQGWFSVKLLYEPFNITSSLENLDNSLPTNEKLRQLEAISSYSEDFKPKDVFLLLNILLSCKDLSKGDLNILQRISTRFCDIPNSVKRDAERLYYTNRMILKIVSLVGSIIDTNTAYTIGNSFQIISCNLNQNKELYLARNFISCQQISEHEYNTNLVYYGNTVAPLFSVIALQSNDLFDQEYETSQILGISTLVTQDTFITKFKITFKHDQYNVPSYSCACWNNHQWSYFHTLQSDSNTSCYINDLEHCEYVTLANLDINKILNDVYSRDDEQDSKCDDTSCTTTLQVTLNALSNHLSELKSSDIDIIFNIFNKIDLDTEEQIEYMADIIDLLMNLDREILAQAQTYNNSTEKLHECINRLVKSYKGSVNIKRKNFAVIIQQKITGILFDRNGPEYFIKDVISNAEQMDSCHTALLINNTYQNTVGP
uniref:Uncharacterized protein LOC114335403 n=1 Tax=Diabrotica virgifera virgifera TaxID=50390 RepID=A0A6P7G348_DIAVI